MESDGLGTEKDAPIGTLDNRPQLVRASIQAGEGLTGRIAKFNLLTIEVKIENITNSKPGRTGNSHCHITTVVPDGHVMLWTGNAELRVLRSRFRGWWRVFKFTRGRWFDGLQLIDFNYIDP